MELVTPITCVSDLRSIRALCEAACIASRGGELSCISRDFDLVAVEVMDFSRCRVPDEYRFSVKPETMAFVSLNAARGEFLRQKAEEAAQAAPLLMLSAAIGTGTTGAIVRVTTESSHTTLRELLHEMDARGACIATIGVENGQSSLGEITIALVKGREAVREMRLQLHSSGHSRLTLFRPDEAPTHTLPTAEGVPVSYLSPSRNLRWLRHPSRSRIGIPVLSERDQDYEIVAYEVIEGSVPEIWESHQFGESPERMLMVGMRPPWSDQVIEKALRSGEMGWRQRRHRRRPLSTRRRKCGWRRVAAGGSRSV